jgi:hypothetical protein
MPQRQHLGAQMLGANMLQGEGMSVHRDQEGQLDKQHFIVVFVQH